MKNSLFALAVSTAALAAPAVSHADAGGFFVNGNIGYAQMDKGAYNDSGTGGAAQIGYRWAFSPSVALGLEGGYTYLGNFGVKSSFANSGIQSASVKGWNLGINGHFNFTPEWYVSARGGYFRGNLKGGFLDSAGNPVNVSTSNSNKFYAGVGLGYDFSNNFSIGVAYDYYRANTQGLSLEPDLFSVSAEYRF